MQQLFAQVRLALQSERLAATSRSALEQEMGSRCGSVLNSVRQVRSVLPSSMCQCCVPIDSNSIFPLTSRVRFNTEHGIAHMQAMMPRLGGSVPGIMPQTAHPEDMGLASQMAADPSMYGLDERTKVGWGRGGAFRQCSTTLHSQRP